MSFQGSIVILRAKFASTESFLWVNFQQLVYQIHQIWFNFGLRFRSSAFRYFTVHLEVTICMKRCRASTHLVQNTSESPQIRGLDCIVIIQHLWRHVKSSSYKSACDLRTTDFNGLKQRISVVIRQLIKLDLFGFLGIR